MSLQTTLKFIVGHPLNKHRKIDAILRFLRWQIAGRLVAGDFAFDWVNGTRLFAKLGETGVTGNIYCGLHDFWEMAYVLHMANSADLFVDVGANAGSYTVLACAAKGAKGLCFEPVPSTYQRLLNNIRLNDISSRVCAFNFGLSDREGELLFTTGENCTNHVIATGEWSREMIRVRVSTLDAVLQGRCPTIIKIDVEGFESSVIKGAEATLSNPVLHSVVMELNGGGKRYGFSEDRIHDTMCEHGFSACEYEPFSRRLSPLDGKHLGPGNTLFVRNGAAVRALIAQAPTFVVNGIEI
jgi:FkbM family methyltransferase